MVRPMRKTRAPTQSQRAIGHITALPFIATMFVMYAMVGRSPLQFKMPRLDAYPTPAFLPVQLPHQLPVQATQQTPPVIRIELRRGATTMEMTWPITAAPDCAAWMRQLLR